MSPLVTTLVDDLLDIPELERAWNGPADTAAKATSRVNQAQLTVSRNTASDFQDRQVFLYLDGELWGKVKYGRPVTREIPPGATPSGRSTRCFHTPSRSTPWRASTSDCAAATAWPRPDC